MLGDLAVLAAQVDRDERRILAAALVRLGVTDDEEERRVLGEVIEGARAAPSGSM
ncbi:hypothetical protein [Rhodocyclus purpureus]|uniref:hypothetical protein n=1 Tax=Rhodocyclus purpureus TaxID=1067 RepID=UPI0019119F98|nr:hypothetical protein [Rhodocyclus purpureus]